MKKLLIAAALAAGLSGAVSAKTLATVNGQKIDSSEVEFQVKNIVEGSSNQIKDTPQLRQDILRQLEARMLLVQAAKKQGLDKDPRFVDSMKQAEAAAANSGDDKKPGFKQSFAEFQDNALAQFYQFSVAEKAQVTDQQARAAYDALKKRYEGTREVLLGEIITRDEQTARQAVADLNAKKKFADVAKKYSIDPAAQKTGGINEAYFPLSDLQTRATPVYDAVKDLKKGQYTTQPIRNNDGIYALFYVSDLRNFKAPAFKDVQPAIVRNLKAEHVREALKQLESDAVIKN